MKSKLTYLIQRLISFLQKFVPTESKEQIDFGVTSSDSQIFGKGKNKITINGNTFYTDDKDVSVINDKIYVGGKLIKGGLTGTVKVDWTGPAADIDCTSLVINGDVQGSVDATSVSITGSVEGDVDGTSIKVGGNVGKNVDGTTITVAGQVIGRVRR